MSKEGERGSDEDRKRKEDELPKCKHCGSVPIACKQPNDCKWEDLSKSLRTGK